MYKRQAEFHPTKEIYTFEEVLKSVSESLRSQISRENLEKLFSYNVSNEKLLAALSLIHICLFRDCCIGGESSCDGVKDAGDVYKRQTWQSR